MSNLNRWSSVKLPRGTFIVNIENMFLAIMFGMKSSTGTLYAFVNHFMPCVSFYTLLKTSENQTFSYFVSGIELDQWHEISISWKGKFAISFFVRLFSISFMIPFVALKSRLKKNIDLNFLILLIHFMPQVSFYTCWKYQKKEVFLCFRRYKKRPV